MICASLCNNVRIHFPLTRNFIYIYSLCKKYIQGRYNRWMNNEKLEVWIYIENFKEIMIHRFYINPLTTRQGIFSDCPNRMLGMLNASIWGKGSREMKHIIKRRKLWDNIWIKYFLNANEIVTLKIFCWTDHQPLV